MVKFKICIALLIFILTVSSNIYADSEPYFSPTSIDEPTWTKPDIILDTTITIGNSGIDPLIVASVTPVWMSHSGLLDYEGTGSFTVPPGGEYPLTLYLNATPNAVAEPAIGQGYYRFEWDYNGGSVDSFFVRFIVADTVQFPEYAEIRTESFRLTFDNMGGLGNHGIGGYNMGFFNDCDTTGNSAGDNDNASVYLREASPFVSYIDWPDTLIINNVYNSNWLGENCFWPTEGVVIDSTSYSDYQYGNTGKFLALDSSIGIVSEYYAPKSSDSSSFIIIQTTVVNNKGIDVNGIIFGEITDWDIPSDSGVANGSGYDETRKAIYCYGGEYSADQIANNDCVLADQRVGGLIYYDGYYNYNNSSSDPVYLRAMWTENNSEWIEPTGNIVGSQLTQKLDMIGGGYETWEATGDFENPDSMYTDLHTVSIYGNSDLEHNEYFRFIKIYAVEYDNGVPGFWVTVDKARQWIENRPELFSFIPCMNCCYIAGDANDDNTVNILDIGFLIAYLYGDGSENFCYSEGDANGDNAINILDVTYLIAYLYSGGPDPICECYYL